MPSDCAEHNPEPVMGNERTNQTTFIVAKMVDACAIVDPLLNSNRGCRNRRQHCAREPGSWMRILIAEDDPTLAPQSMTVRGVGYRIQKADPI